VFGATIELTDMGSNEVVTYQIVGDDEGRLEARARSRSARRSRAR
jgi:transcription elongation GreA/GreB family factor